VCERERESKRAEIWIAREIERGHGMRDKNSAKERESERVCMCAAECVVVRERGVEGRTP
jgi:hypothetical protein